LFLHEIGETMTCVRYEMWYLGKPTTRWV